MKLNNFNENSNLAQGALFKWRPLTVNKVYKRIERMERERE